MSAHAATIIERAFVINLYILVGVPRQTFAFTFFNFFAPKLLPGG